LTRALFIAAFLLLLCGLSARAATAAPENAIVAENALPGTTAWQRSLFDGIELYGTAITAAPGDQPRQLPYFRV
jgi:hypothetical protein